MCRRSLIAITATAAAVPLSLYYTHSLFSDPVHPFHTHCTRLLHKIDPETAHNLALFFAKHRLTPSDSTKYPQLQTKVWALPFESPVGLAAGFDKNGEAIDGLVQLGFSFVEIGTVVPEEQAGNARPRVFRLLDDRAIINRYGFNSKGIAHVLHNLSVRRERQLQSSTNTSTPQNESPMHGDPVILGVNIGVNKANTDNPFPDYQKGINAFAEFAHYIVINVSSPNTVGLRSLQAKDRIFTLLQDLLAERDRISPSTRLLLKISPDLTVEQECDIASVVNKLKVDGLIIANTTVQRPESLKSSASLTQEIGGLSGPALKERCNAQVKRFYSLVSCPIVAVGGIETGRDVWDRMGNGASLVQLYTVLAYEGAGVVKRIKQELQQCMAEEGITDIRDHVGRYCRK